MTAPAKQHDCFSLYQYGDPSPWTCPECGTVWQVRNARWDVVQRPVTFGAKVHDVDAHSASSHVRILVYGGRQPGSRALLGQLTCERGAEADALIERLTR